MYRIEGATHTGMVRDHNEDRCSMSMLADDYGYLLVCDGMGGENGGSTASALACEEICRVLDNSYRSNIDENSIYRMLETAIDNANTTVYRMAQEQEDLSRMGTTVSLAILSGDTCYLANVGDSRVYLFRSGAVTQLTVDHTHVQTLIDSGEITPQQAKTHPQRHYLTKAVGVSPNLTPFFIQHTLNAGDLLLLCSDGLYNMMDEETLAGLLARVAAGESCQLLIDQANRLGGNDNITAVVAVAGQEVTG